MIGYGVLLIAIGMMAFGAVNPKTRWIRWYLGTLAIGWGLTLVVISTTEYFTQL